MSKQQIVQTKVELKKAIDENAEEIIVVGEYAKKLKKVAKFYSLSPKKRKAIITGIGGLGALAITSIAATPATGGASALVGGVSIAAFSASTGASISLISSICALCITIGTANVLTLLRYKDVEEVNYTVTTPFGEFSKGVKLSNKSNQDD